MTDAADWIGRVGEVWADEWRRTDRAFAGLSSSLDAAIAGAAPNGRFRALDIGCGAGGTSLALARTRPEAAVIGIDLSAPMVSIARQRAATGEGEMGRGVAPDGNAAGTTTFLAGDALALATDHAPFDLLYSRHGVMFFDDPVAAFTSLRSAAAPGATLIFSCFRDWSLNTFASAVSTAIGGTPPPAGPGPFAFADEAHVAAILRSAGWQAARATEVDFAYRVGAGDDPVTDALAFLQRIGPAASRIRGAAPEDRADLIERLTGVIARYRSGSTVDFPAAAWIWTARA